MVPFAVDSVPAQSPRISAGAGLETGNVAVVEVLVEGAGQGLAVGGELALELRPDVGDFQRVGRAVAANFHRQARRALVRTVGQRLIGPDVEDQRQLGALDLQRPLPVADDLRRVGGERQGGTERQRQPEGEGFEVHVSDSRRSAVQ
jgi:hypothetical protein